MKVQWAIIFLIDSIDITLCVSCSYLLLFQLHRDSCNRKYLFLLQSLLEYSYINSYIETFLLLPHCKGEIRTQLNIYDGAFLKMEQKSSIVDVRVGSKYASA